MTERWQITFDQPFIAPPLAAETRRFLSGLSPDDEVDVHIRGAGGFGEEGLAIVAYLQAFPGKTTAYYESGADSAHFEIGLGCDLRIASEKCLFLIHNGEIPGDALQGQRLRAGDFLDYGHGLQAIDRISLDLMVEASAGRASEEQLAALLKSDTTLTAQEALELGLIDEIRPITFFEEAKGAANKRSFQATKKGGPMAFKLNSGLGARLRALLDEPEPEGTEPEGTEPENTEPEQGETVTVQVDVLTALLDRVEALEAAQAEAEAAQAKAEEANALLEGLAATLAEAEVEEELEDAPPAAKSKAGAALKRLHRQAMKNGQQGADAREIVAALQGQLAAPHLKRRLGGGGTDTVPKAEEEGPEMKPIASKNVPKVLEHFPSARRYLKED